MCFLTLMIRTHALFFTRNEYTQLLENVNAYMSNVSSRVTYIFVCVDAYAYVCVFNKKFQLHNLICPTYPWGYLSSLREYVPREICHNYFIIIAKFGIKSTYKSNGERITVKSSRSLFHISIHRYRFVKRTSYIRFLHQIIVFLKKK